MKLRFITTKILRFSHAHKTFGFVAVKIEDFYMPQKSLIFEGFWGTNRTGKVNKYVINKIENIEFGESVSRFIFTYEGKRVVLPLKKKMWRH